DLMVVQTNNATYGRTSLPAQQLAMSRLRAVEHGRTILVAATSGISAIVGPDGRVLDRSREFVPDIQVRTAPAPTSATLSDRLGAVGHGGTIVAAAPGGLSASVGPAGRVLDRSREFVPDIQVRTVPARTSATLSDRLGAAPEWLLAALGLGALCAAAWAARNNSARDDEGH